MIIPPLYKADSVFEDADLNRKAECICGKHVLVKGKCVLFSHRLNETQYGWFTVCKMDCFTTHISKGTC